MKKPTISIFVSGAKRLKEQRMSLKVLANDMNGEYRKKGIDIIINMYSYLNFGDNQKEYDDFIKNKADIVMFILEESIGDKTREEFLLASETYRNEGSPKMYVFLKEFNQKTPEIEDIEQLVNAHSSSYYIEYSNLEDLVAKVRQRLQQDVNERLEKQNATPEKKIKNLTLWSLFSTLAFASMLFFSIFKYMVRDTDVTLLFVGGGSAVQCMEQDYPSVGNLYDYPNSICLAVPTSTSWPIVSSDVMLHHADKENHDAMKFFPISLSAMEAAESNFLKMSSINQFTGKGAVLSYLLGEDYLAVYVKKSYKNALIDNKDSITTPELAEFLRSISNQDVMIFTTDEGSGTLTYYQKYLSPYDITISKGALGDNVDKFSDLTPKSKIRRDESPYIMLGSRFFVAKEVYDEGDCRPIVVLDENKKVISKSIYLYFAGYYEDEGTSYWIPDEMVELLYKIDERFKGLIKNNKIPRQNERVIVSLNEYLDTNG